VLSLSGSGYSILQYIGVIFPLGVGIMMLLFLGGMC
jgi:hypothetical protein